MILSTSHQWRWVYRGAVCACLALLMVWLLREAAQPQGTGSAPADRPSGDAEPAAPVRADRAATVIAIPRPQQPAPATARQRRRHYRLLGTRGSQWSALQSLLKMGDTRAVPLLVALCDAHYVPASHCGGDPTLRRLTPQWGADRLAELVGTERTPRQWVAWFQQRRRDYAGVSFHHAYQVRGGDTLTSISERVYGHSRGWNAIYDANRMRIGAPDLLSVGQVLSIPEPDPTRARAVADASAQPGR